VLGRGVDRRPAALLARVDVRPRLHEQPDDLVVPAGDGAVQRYDGHVVGRDAVDRRPALEQQRSDGRVTEERREMQRGEAVGRDVVRLRRTARRAARAPGPARPVAAASKRSSDGARSASRSAISGWLV
jgi:hypothetical protein